MIAELVYYIVVILGACCIVSAGFAAFAWIGRTLDEKLTPRVKVTRQPLPDAADDLRFLRHLGSLD